MRRPPPHSAIMQPSIIATMSLAALLLLAACHQAPPPPAASYADIEAAQQAAQREVADARTEATKDVKSAAKVSGSDSAVVTDAKVTAKYDIEMAKADGDHKIATEKCLTLTATAQPACRQQADAAYDAAQAAAKAARLASRR